MAANLGQVHGQSWKLRCFKIAEPKHDRREEKMCVLHFRRATFLARLEGIDPPELRNYNYDLKL